MMQPLSTDELDYELPERLIATRPAEPRDAARMLVLHRHHDTIEHRHVRDLPEYVQRGDALVFNTTAVTPARLLGQRADTGGRVEGLFLNDNTNAGHATTWQVMLKSNGKLKAHQRVILHDTTGHASPFEIELLERADETWLVKVHSDDHTATILEQIGRTPLPPYILRARGEQTQADALDRAWYQTVYASSEQAHRRSVAAPTAGLHFTPTLLDQLTQRGAQRLDVLLHVGAGTFKPITAATLDQHQMHREQYEVPAATLAALRQIKHDGTGRVIAIGTTTVRTLESLPDPLPTTHAPIRSETNLLISPGYSWRYVDALLTNFHLPRSTLLALVGAMTGLERLKAVYAEAISRDYRFYSYGDAMLIL